MEPAEGHIVLEIAENRLHLGGTGRSQSFPFRAGQIGPGLFAIFQELEADQDLPVAFGFGTPASQGTVGAVLTSINPPLRLIAVIGGIEGGGLEVQAFVSRTNELVGVRVIAEVLGAELVGAQHLRIAVVVIILVEGVVLKEVLRLMLFYVGIILFTAIGRIGHNLLGPPSAQFAA